MSNPKSLQEALDRVSVIEKEAAELRTYINSIEPKDIKDRVKTFEDALKIYINQYGPISATKKSLLEYSGDDKDMIAAQGFLQMSIIRAVLNEGWTPNWEDGTLKYYPWFKHSGSGLSCDVYGYGTSGSDVGSRLCFKSSDLAKYAGTQFISIYSKFHTL